MSAIIRDIRDTSVQLPESLVIDTSLLLELVPLDPPHSFHTIAINFLNRLRKAAHLGQVIPLIPYLVLEEFYFKICQKYLVSLANQSGIRWNEYYKQNPESIDRIHPTLVKHYQMLQAFPMVIIEPEDLFVSPTASMPSVADCMTDYIGQFRILPKDATILSEAKRLGIFNIATLDKDYERADGFTVFLPISKLAS